MIYAVIFSDEKLFKFTKQQLILIPYFDTLLSSSFEVKELIEINSSSIGFEFIHMYATMDEIEIIDPHDKYLFVLKQCDYFAYDKLKSLIESKYGYKSDISNVKEKIGFYHNLKLKYLGKLTIKTRKAPIFSNISTGGCIIHKLDDIDIDKDGYKTQCIGSSSGFLNFIKISSHPLSEFKLHQYFNITISEQTKMNGNSHDSYYTFTGIGNCVYDHKVKPLIYLNSNLYMIYPVCECPKYSIDLEIDEIYKKRYRLKYNLYFIKMIKDNAIFENGKVCVKIDDNYKLLSEVDETKYDNIECIILDHIPKFKKNILIKYVENDIELYSI